MGYLFANDLLIVKKYMFAEIQLNYLNKRYEVTKNDLLGAAYSEHDNVTGNYMTVGVESLAIDLIELSALHDKKVKPYKKEMVIFNQMLKQLNQIDQSNLYHAVNNEHELFTNHELQLLIMTVGTQIEDNHHTKQDTKSRKQREQYINKLKTKLKGANINDNQNRTRQIAAT